MHIVYVSREYPPSLRGGGIASYVKEMAYGMVAAGNQVTVVCASDDTRVSADVQEQGVRVIRLKGGNFLIPAMEKKSHLRRWRSLYRFHSYMKRIRNTILQLKDVDIIEVPDYGAEGYYLKNLQIPVVMRLHTPGLFDHNSMGIVHFSLKLLPFYWQGLQELRLIKETKYITSCSTSLKEWVMYNLGKNGESIQVIYNPVNTKVSNNLAEGVESKGKEVTILFAGTICDWKGCGDLAEVGILLDEKLKRPFKIKYVGKTGTYSDWLKKKYGAFKWFDIVGKVSREHLQNMFKMADVVIFPSWWENMPMVCIEAMLQGAIVIGSNSGGMNEIIEDGRSGWLLAPKNPEAWAEKIIKVLAMSASDKKAMSEEAQKRIKEYFSTEIITEKTIEYYKNVINDFKK